MMTFKHFAIFLIINFACLGLSQWIMADGLNSDWYAKTPKAPWTPPGWFFGVAWFSIMTLFATYLAILAKKGGFKPCNQRLYAMILFLCVIWNVVFFAWQQLLLGIVILVALAVCVMAMAKHNYREMRVWTWLLAPFIAWSFVATSLNIYSIL